VDPSKKKENTMITGHTCVYMLMVSGILLFAGCSFLANKPQTEAQLDRTALKTQSKSLAGSYRNVGSDGSIKPHSSSSYKMSQEPPTQTGVITLGGSADMPDMKNIFKRETGGTMPRSGSTSAAGGK